jgi:transposase-like protein
LTPATRGGTNHFRWVLNPIVLAISLMRKVRFRGVKRLMLELFALIQSGVTRTDLGQCPACRSQMELLERRRADDRHEVSFFKCPLCAKEYQIPDVSD